MANHTGARNNNTKLTQSQVVAMRVEKALNNDSNKMLAERYGVTESTVTSIIRRDTWRNV